MTHLSGHDRPQLLLLPEAIDDYRPGQSGALLGQILYFAGSPWQWAGTNLPFV